MVRKRSPNEKEQNRIRMSIIGQDSEYRKLRADYIRKRKTRRKYWINKYREALGCVRCGIKGPFCIFDWHHLGDKDFNINDSYSKNLKRLMNEIRKCINVCANCHRLIHHEERYPNGS